MGLMDDAKKVATNAMRAVKDTISPPTTAELAARACGDAWRETKKGARGLGKEAKTAFEAADDLFEDFASNPHQNAQRFAKGAKEFGKDMADEVRNAPGVSKLIKFVQAAGHVVAAVFGTDKDRTSAWSEFKKASQDLVKSIAQVVGLDTKKGHVR